MFDARYEAMLSRVVRQAGWSRREFSRRVLEEAAVAGRATQVTQDDPFRWLDGVEPPSYLQKMIAGLLQRELRRPVSPRILGWSVDGDPDPRDLVSKAWRPSSTLAAVDELTEGGAVNRRNFLALTGSGLVTSVEQWAADPERVTAAAGDRRITSVVVDELDRAAVFFSQIDDTMGSGRVRSLVREQIKFVAALVRDCSYTETIGRRLYAVLAELSRLAGWLAYDGGDWALAQRYYLTALRAAQTANNYEYTVNALGYMSYCSSFVGDPRDAAFFADTARSYARHLTPAVAASIEARYALAAARLGARDDFVRAQDKVFDLLAVSDRANEPEWIYWFGTGDANALAGRASLYLQQPQRAAVYLGDALAELGPEYQRDRAQYMGFLVTAQVAAGDLELAAATAKDMIDIAAAVDSHQVQQGLEAVAADLSPYRGTSAVRRLAQDYPWLFSEPS